MRDIAKIVQKLGESVKRYVARFRTVQTKYTTVITKRDNMRLVQDGLLWSLKKTLPRNYIHEVYHLSSDIAMYEKARTARVQVRPKRIGAFTIEKWLRCQPSRLVIQTQTLQMRKKLAK